MMKRMFGRAGAAGCRGASAREAGRHAARNSTIARTARTPFSREAPKVAMNTPMSPFTSSPHHPTTPSQMIFRPILRLDNARHLVGNVATVLNLEVLRVPEDLLALAFPGGPDGQVAEEDRLCQAGRVV